MGKQAFPQCIFLSSMAMHSLLENASVYGENVTEDIRGRLLNEHRKLMRCKRMQVYSEERPTDVNRSDLQGSVYMIAVLEPTHGATIAPSSG